MSEYCEARSLCVALKYRCRFKPAALLVVSTNCPAMIVPGKLALFQTKVYVFVLAKAVGAAAAGAAFGLSVAAARVAGFVVAGFAGDGVARSRFSTGGPSC